MAQTLDQQRAAFAWDVAKRARASLPEFADFKNLAKGAPALVMGNGLMPALAFYASRDKRHASALNDAINGWLATRFSADPSFRPLPKTYADVMERLLKSPSSFYMHATDETLAMLKWLRQFADALDKERG
ncbi:MAG: type III-B CRISPR module-associated protein Cmr5 [Rubrivivax sp.]